VVVGSLLMCGFAGTWHNNIRRPILVDPAAMTWAVTSAVLSLAGMPTAAVAVALLAGCVKETAPTFASAFSLDPLLLIGLAAPAVRRFR
jgi:hypothetical protein